MKVRIGPRVNRVVIEPRDLWALDYTLATIIAPALKELRKNPVDWRVEFLEDSDGNLLFDANGQPMEDTNAPQLWKEKLDKMIWSFEQVAEHGWVDDSIEPNDPDLAAKTADYHQRIQEGIDLFAKHFSNLWS